MTQVSPLLEALGGRLRARRLEAGLTQADLAERAGVSPRFLVQLETGRGNISVSRLAELCSVLDLPLYALFRGLGPRGREKIALVGLRGAGKSTVGAALARELAVPFIETVREVEVAAGMSLAEIFELRGEAFFQALEARVLAEVLDRPGPAVLATGGSVVGSPEAWRLLRERARTVWLQAAPASHLERVRAQGDLRPMRGRPDALLELEAILRDRAALYAQADLSLDTDRLGVAGVVERLAGG